MGPTAAYPATSIKSYMIMNNGSMFGVASRTGGVEEVHADDDIRNLPFCSQYQDFTLNLVWGYLRAHVHATRSKDTPHTASCTVWSSSEHASLSWSPTALFKPTLNVWQQCAKFAGHCDDRMRNFSLRHPGGIETAKHFLPSGGVRTRTREALHPRRCLVRNHRNLPSSYLGHEHTDHHYFIRIHQSKRLAHTHQSKISREHIT